MCSPKAESIVVCTHFKWQCQNIIQRKPLKEKYVHKNTATGILCNELISTVKKTGWIFCLSIYDGIALETAEYQQVARQGWIRLIIALLVLLLLTCHMFFWRWKINLFLYPALCIVSIICVITAYNYKPQQSENDVLTSEHFASEDNDIDGYNSIDAISIWDPKRIVDQGSLGRYLDQYQKESMLLYNESAKVIPTGIYLYNITFLDSHRIQLTGTFWQKVLDSQYDYPPTMTSKYQDQNYEKLGVFIPGAHVEELEQVDSIAVVMDGYPAILYRWNFEVEVERQMSFALYPFGKNVISFQLWSNNLDDNTVLIPDLDSYKQLYPTSNPGLDNHFDIKGWNVQSSYFSYSNEAYLCNFGNTGMYGINKFPELVFNISISRKFIDILVCKIIPLLVVLVLLFTILFVRVISDGFNNIIGCSGLFFVLVVDHIHLRETVMSERIMYLEFFYFFAYTLLLLITVTSFDNGKDPTHSYSSWVDLFLKKYYWSLFFGAMTIVTVCYFY